MLTRMRDEAHRFAITFQQKLMRRRNFHSVLEDIPGIGEGRKKALLKTFGSLKRVREATIEQLTEVVGPTMAERLHGYLHGEPPDAEEEEVIRESSLADAAEETGPSNSSDEEG
jgi:excinuclease ABC subunit C